MLTGDGPVWEQPPGTAPVAAWEQPPPCGHDGFVTVRAFDGWSMDYCPWCRGSRVGGVGPFRPPPGEER